MIKKPEKRYSPVELERKIQEYWKSKAIYKKVKYNRENGEDYYFIDGPPYTSGNVHMGTAWNKSLKDTYLRYRRMHNYNIRDQPGYDMHGLPIEVLVEKEMGIKNKKDIEKIGIEKFIEKCKEFAVKNKDVMTEQFKALGIWMDWDNPYITITDEYIEAAWWTLRRAQEKELLTRALRVLPWCPRCETALAEAEIEYWEEEDPSIYLKFELLEEENTYILIWTTTPWTIPGNLAAAVHPDYVYLKIKVNINGNDEHLILLEETVNDVLAVAGIDKYAVVDRMGGSQLIGKKYRHPLEDLIVVPEKGDFFKKEFIGGGQQTKMVPVYTKFKSEWLHKVILFEDVEADMSGIVHIAPGHGPEDFELGKEYNLPPFCPVDEEGRLTKQAGKYAGIPVKDANQIILDDLTERGALLHRETITHRYGHCWRCKTPIIYRTTKQWFLKITELKEKMLEEVGKIKWYPDWAGSSRQADWVNNARDWCISRQRYWGIPLPIWECKNHHTLVIGSRKELQKHATSDISKLKELHRPWVDGVVLTCPDCGEHMRRCKDVLDVWLDSGVCSWAQLGYPSREDEFKRWFPCKWIVEAHDQTRGWFYSQLGAGIIAFDKSPYESVLMHGFALDSDGKPMSKSLGNVINSDDVVKEFGADALRSYIMKTSAPWEDIAFSMEGVKNAGKALNILWNTYVFAATYMSLDKFSPSKVKLDKIMGSLKTEDLWIFSRLEATKQAVTQYMEEYNIHKAYRKLEGFIVDDFSRWYIKLIRDRLWIEGENQDKLNVFACLHKVLSESVTLLAPIAPHICEEIYLNLDMPLESVHMKDWPEVNTELRNETLEDQMTVVQKTVECVANLRQKANINLRWPLSKMVVKPKDKVTAQGIRDLMPIIKKQTNVKAILVLEVGQEWEGLEWEVDPNLDEIGPVFRQWAGRIASLLRTRPADVVMKAIQEGDYTIGIEGQKVKVTANMVNFIPKLPGHILMQEFEGNTLYLDIEMTDELRGEGFGRELIRRIQKMRGEMDLNVEDYIETRLIMSETLTNIIFPHGEKIAEETRTYMLEFVGTPEEMAESYIKEWKISDEQVVIGLVPIAFEEEGAEVAVEEPTEEAAGGAPPEEMPPEEPVAKEEVRETPEEELPPEEVIEEAEEEPVAKEEVRETPEEELPPEEVIEEAEEELVPEVTQEEPTEAEEVTEELKGVEAAPEEAERHVEYLPDVVREALAEAGEGPAEEEIIEEAKPVEEIPEEAAPEVEPEAVEEEQEEEVAEEALEVGPEPGEVAEELAEEVGETAVEEEAEPEAVGEVPEEAAEKAVEDGAVEESQAEEAVEEAAEEEIEAAVEEHEAVKLSQEDAVEAFMKLPGVGRAKAENLYDAGFKNFEAINNATVGDLVKVYGISQRIAQGIKRAVSGVEEEEEEEEEETDAVVITSNTCPLCGAELVEDAAKCERCGTILAEEEVLEVGDVDRKPNKERKAEEETPAEEPEPKPEEKKTELPDIKSGYTYLIKSDSLNIAYDIFKDQISRGKKPLCITRQYPEKLKNKHEFDCKIFWLSQADSHDTIRPRDLERLSFTIHHFINNNPGSMIIMDGIDYLVTNNKFSTVLRLLQSIRDMVSIKKSIMLLAIQPSVFDPQHLKMLEREADSVIEDSDK